MDIALWKLGRGVNQANVWLFFAFYYCKEEVGVHKHHKSTQARVGRAGEAGQESAAEFVVVAAP